MKKIILPFLIASALVACENKTAEKTTEKDSVVVTESAPLNITENVALDSLIEATPVAASSESVDLKFNLQKGQAFNYSATITTENEMQGQSMKTNMAYNYTVEVTDNTKGVKTMKITYGPMGMSMDMNGQKMEFSSEKAASDDQNPLNMVSKMFGAMQGKSFTMKVDEKGDITSVEGMDKIADAMMAEMNVPQEQAAAMKANFRQQFSDETAKEMFGQAFNVFPGRAVKIGESWTKKTSLPMPQMKGSVSTKYTAKEIKGNNLTIDAVSTMDMEGQKKVATYSRMLVDVSSGMVLKVDGQTKQEGSNKVVGRSRITSRPI